jgi:hypothetical protein
MAIHTVVPEPEPRSVYLERQATNQKEQQCQFLKRSLLIPVRVLFPPEMIRETVFLRKSYKLLRRNGQALSAVSKAKFINLM